MEKETQSEIEALVNTVPPFRWQTEYFDHDVKVWALEPQKASSQRRAVSHMVEVGDLEDGKHNPDPRRMVRSILSQLIVSQPAAMKILKSSWERPGELYPSALFDRLINRFIAPFMEEHFNLTPDFLGYNDGSMVSFRKKMKECPSCEGSGRITVTMETYGKPESKLASRIDCVTCNGQGQCDTKILDLLEEHDCCHCRGEELLLCSSPECLPKSHWHCANCGQTTLYK